ncbi:hypothetical protein BKA58DRAFT_121686 [Alternaria rosae]|uniref:uncharacterized protein n=1 Tax=Alternaria rosae TaxID=1187941 RepID=UPI001E8CB7D6|nr:uncharacterized protein BKA58DRAFT_121686 [Alternaria rosae]KAH6875425.1 hypothetical protein BKA58DRAFT_121686 [Alternaria rosae]
MAKNQQQVKRKRDESAKPPRWQEMEEEKEEEDIASVATQTRADAEVEKPTDLPAAAATSIHDKAVNGEEQNQEKEDADGVLPPPPSSPSKKTTPSHNVQSSDYSKGAVLLHSQLMPHGSALSTTSNLNGGFLRVVSKQIDFDVKGRIHTVVPKELRSTFVSNDVMVKLGWVKLFKALLHLWQNAEIETDEFIVE